MSLASCEGASPGAMWTPSWQTNLAEDLGVSDCTVRRWHASTQDVPRGAYTDLLRLTQERAQFLDSLAERLREMG